MFVETNYYQHMKHHGDKQRELERIVREERLARQASWRQTGRNQWQKITRFLSLFL
ncbi:MAG: hypothetical protein KME04_12850 [Pleurocapsa minor GSE-CHR-MK-17-07R]|jgi:hypothetical protein|nr:hypothetical protein [Pleurocapsa minor GSE-CHR-MK 17-07R]